MKKNFLIIVLIFVNIYLIFQEKSLHDSLKDYFAQDQSEEQVQNKQTQNLCKEQSETMGEDEAALPEQDWEPLLAAESCRATENQETAAKLLIGQIIEQNQYDMSRFELEDSCMIQAGGSAKEIYLVRYFEEENWNSNYCGILADYEEETCEMLFQTDKGLPDNSMEEFYDMKMCDVDGNGEQDIILLLGEHRGMGAGYYLPDIYCMIGLQRDGTFQFMSSHTDEWLSEITDMLYEEANENRKVENILPEIRKKFGLSDLITEKDESCSVEEYIRKKDEKILQKIDRRSLFFERELLWEQFFMNEDGNMQSVKIYRESGENGFPAKRAAVYVFDYLTEEAELQAMPQLFEEITERVAGQGYIENVEVEETEFKDIDGDGKEDIHLTIDVEVSEIDGEKKNETYTMNFMQEKDKYNELKMFKGVLADMTVKPDAEDTDTDKDVEAENHMERYYGYYQFTEFYPSIYYGKGQRYDMLRRQEADLMLGKVIKLQPEQLVAYDCTRWLGVTAEGSRFQGNFSIERAEVAEPELQWISIENNEYALELWEWIDTIGTPPEVKQYDIDGAIILPQLFEPWGTQFLYTVSGDASLLSFSTLSGQFFKLEKLDYDAEVQVQEPEEMTEEAIEKTLDNLYGTYRVTEFLPTKFYPARDSAGDTRLPQEEAELMLGKEIRIEENLFVTYDNGRLPNSEFMGRALDDFMLEEIRIGEPDYRVKLRNRRDIYGLRDDMLPEEMVRGQYVEVSVYPGYDNHSERTLPQIYVIDDNTVVLYCMWEYFLLEK